MANAPLAIDIRDKPDVPVTPYATSGSDAQRQALERAAGSWPADDAEDFKKKLRQSRDLPAEPAVEV